MANRKEEQLRIETFEVGSMYSRPEIARLGHVEPLQSTREWTGIVEFLNCVVLFSTLEKDDLPPEHAYADFFSDTAFYWESQNRNTQTTPIILRITSLEAPVLLFCRLTAKTRSKATPFVFAGKVTAEDYDGNNPVEVRFNVDDYQHDPPEQLRQLYDWRPGTVRKLKPIELPDRKPRVGSGQGRQSDPKKRKAVEMRAMSIAKQHYEKLGYSVTDTSANNPYDLECSKGGETIRVEVKGLTGAIGVVEVTIGEILSARDEDCRTDLFVVHSISLKETSKTNFVGEGGDTHIEVRWCPPDTSLEAIRFKYSPQI